MAGIEKIKIPVRKNELTLEAIKPYLPAVFEKFCDNQKKIRHFWEIYENKHEIYNKTRRYEDDSDINNKVATPHLWAIVNFKSGYALGNPKEYAQTEENQTDDIKYLNKYSKSANMRTIDKNVANWVYATGVGYYFIEPKSEIYDPETMRKDVEGNCIWIGGDERYKYFSIPKWYSARNQIATNIVISDLNIDNIQNGNLLTGVLAISGGRQISIDDEMSFEDKLKKQFENVGIGLAVSYVENANRDQPINMDYINLTNNNYTYIRTTYEDNEQSILECWFMPKIRLLNNTDKESMNSNKSEVLWNIYLRSCNNMQREFLSPIHRFNRYYFKSHEKLNVALPTFENQTTVVLDNVRNLMDMGLMSRKEAIEYINQQNLDFKLWIEDNIFDRVK